MMVRKWYGGGLKGMGTDEGNGSVWIHWTGHGRSRYYIVGVKTRDTRVIMFAFSK